MFKRQLREEKTTISRRDIDEKLKVIGDYVKIDFLAGCLKKNLDFDTRRFVLLKLSQLYEAKRMMNEAARMMVSAADLSSTYDGKMNDYMRASELFLKNAAYDESDVSFNKAMACANSGQKESIKAKRKEGYKLIARELLNKDKRTHALAAYERLLGFGNLTSEEKREVQSTLLHLYEQLGKVKEFYSLKANMQ